MLRSFRLLPVVAATVFASLAPASLSAQAAGALPPAKDLIARYVAAIGGRDALMKHATMRSVGTFEMPAAGLKGDLNIVQTRDGRTAMTMNIPGMGEIAGGFDGTTAWSMNPMQGARVLDGKELEQMKEDAGFATMLRESAAIKSAETVEASEIAGVKCYKVKVTYLSGRTSFDCYAMDSGLLAGTLMVQESQMGTMEITNAMGEWKEFGGVKIPTRMRQQAMGQEQVMTVTTVTFDGADDAKALELPAAVKALKKP